MHLKKIFKLIISLATAVIFFPAFASAQTQGPLDRLWKVGVDSGYETTRAGDNTFIATSASSIINAFLSLLGIIFIYLIVLAGYDYMTARGEEQKVEKALGTIRRAIVGLVIILASYAIWNYIYYYLILGQT